MRSRNDQSRTDSTCLTQKSVSLEFRVAMPYMVVIRLSKPAIAFDIKVEPLEQSCIAKNTTTAAFGCFDLIVRAFDKAAAKTTSKVIDNFIEPIIECYQELIWRYLLCQ